MATFSKTKGTAYCNSKPKTTDNQKLW